MIQRMRILAWVGLVGLVAARGVWGGPGELRAAENASEAIKLAAQANSDFAFDLYQQVAKENAGKNLFFSPYSVSSALAMTAEGARGKTAEEMGKVLRFPESARRPGGDAQLRPWRTALINTGMSGLSERLMGKDEATEKAARDKIAALQKVFDAAHAKVLELRKAREHRNLFKAQQAEQKAAKALNEALARVDQYELRVANALWGEKTYPFLDSYVNTINKHYSTGGIFPCDFKTNFPAERAKINKWVEEQTNNRIKDLIPNLDPEQAKLLRLVLTNAIYFKGQWSVPFKEADTKPRAFALADGKKIQTPIMNARNLAAGRYAAFHADGSAFNTPRRIRPGQKEGLYPDAKGFAVLELPYKGDDLSMVVIAPNSPDGLGAMETALTAEHLAGWVAKLQKRKVHVFLPKFKLETEYEMNDMLQAMGMVRAFNAPGGPDGADFSGMCASRDPMDRLSISKVIHKAFVEVTEKGTEAAAATAVMMVGATAAPTTVPFTPTFQADRPFVFLIRDRRTDSVLFLGRVTDPSAK